VDPRARCLRTSDQPLEVRVGERRARSDRGLFQRAFDVRQLRFDPRHRLAEEPEPLEHAHDIGADALPGTEVDDVHGEAAADAVEPSDALFHCRGLPGQVVEHQTPAELEVASLAARFGRYQDARAVLRTEPGDLHVAPRRREPLVKHAAGELRPSAQRVAQHLQRLAVRGEDERFLVLAPPALRLGQKPLEPRIGSIHGLRLLAPLDLVGPEHRTQCRTGRECPADAIRRAPPGHRIGGRIFVSSEERRIQREGRARKIDGSRRARRQAADVDAPRRAGARRQRLP
jgi:hypothetical protein